MKLTQHISSNYVAAANALRPQNARRRIVAYVESYDDVLFWRLILSRFENGSRYFEVMLPTRSNEERKCIGRGKKSAIQCLMANTGSDMIACVDADYDYLMQGTTESSRMMLNNPYVFHTYAYSIENLQCYAPSLHNTCVMATLNDHSIFDFNTFMVQYSEAVWPLFTWSVALYRENNMGAMSILDMDKVIYPGKLKAENAFGALSCVRAKVQKRVTALRRAYPDTAKRVPRLREELKSMGIQPADTYLYIHGHSLFDKVVLPLMMNVCSTLVREREQEIHQQALHHTQMSNELSCYINSRQDVTQMLKKSTGYMMSPVLDNIVNQLRVLFI